MDMQMTDRIRPLTSGAPTSLSWASAADIGESGQAATLSPEASKMINEYRNVRSNWSLTYDNLSVFAYAQLWHDEKDSSKSVSTIIWEANTYPDTLKLINDYFVSQSHRKQSHYFTWSFNQQSPTRPSFLFFARIFRGFLKHAAQQTPSVKTEMRQSIWPSDMDSIMLDWLYTIEDSKESMDLELWRRFHKNWKKPGPRPPRG